MFFKRLLTVWFILFTLNSSMAWAFSDHSAEEHAVSQAGDNNDEQPSRIRDGDTCNDHCSHSSAHTVALISTTAALNIEAESTDFHVCQRIPDSRQPAPPFQPPIS